MPQDRLNRDEFYARLAALNEEQLKKALWTLYWRGAAPVRQRIEAEISPLPAARRPAAPDPPDPARVLERVRSFTELARSGAYIAGDRRVSPKERSRWRVTFRGLADEARHALAADGSEPADLRCRAASELVTALQGVNSRQSWRSVGHLHQLIRKLPTWPSAQERR